MVRTVSLQADATGICGTLRPPALRDPPNSTSDVFMIACSNLYEKLQFRKNCRQNLLIRQTFANDRQI
jgi:hypothetical protein